MSEPWFDAIRYSWLPGTLLGVAGGVMGTLMGTLAPLGRGRVFLTGVMWTTTGVCAVLFCAGVAGLLMGQPFGVWYGLGLPGLLGTMIFGILTPLTSRVYQMVEQRKITAKDIGP